MIRVHHLNNSRSQRILWLLEELERPYEIVRYERDPTSMAAPPELKAVHPLGKSPVVEVDGRVIAESGAIVEYLAGEPGGQLVPATGTDDHVAYLHFLHFAEGSAQPPLLLKLYLNFMGAAAPEPIVRRIDTQIAGVLDYLETALGSSGWFAGAGLTAADIQMSFPLEVAVHRGGLNESRPRLMDFLKRIHARPSYRRAIERGGAYAFD